ncbi:sulfur carrier protein ThiS [Cohnella boryungensis]|uniref:Sulfur carrier protein ThiS n=1 Tax=Cohnella boryungensis TaxID=768479 RepID=A0ABV8SGH6_9BACL
MELIVNGRMQTLEVGTILELVEHYELTGKPVMVEADGQVIASEQWASTAVQPSMRIELVHFVGGG